MTNCVRIALAGALLLSAGCKDQELRGDVYVSAVRSSSNGITSALVVDFVVKSWDKCSKTGTCVYRQELEDGDVMVRVLAEGVDFSVEDQETGARVLVSQQSCLRLPASGRLYLQATADSSAIVPNSARVHVYAHDNTGTASSAADGCGGAVLDEAVWPVEAATQPN